MSLGDDPYAIYPFDEDLRASVTIVGYVDDPATSLPRVVRELHLLIQRHFADSPAHLLAGVTIPAQALNESGIQASLGWTEEESSITGCERWQYEIARAFQDIPDTVCGSWVDLAITAGLQISYRGANNGDEPKRSSLLWAELLVEGNETSGMVMAQLRARKLAQLGREHRHHLIRDCIRKVDAAGQIGYALIDMCGSEEAAAGDVYLDDRWAAPTS